ncbi:unnamed protein product [Prorocentrum cordatum]|uniref:RRM domain-containing protein n=1 Tax=Prorocentrum cordatum TaxID=2364126 RepID=A0ABN9XND4_9DINO|nr:unnamed protein product [Polarella glacialis]
MSMQAVSGTAAPQQRGHAAPVGNLGLQCSPGARRQSMGPAAVPPSHHAGGTPERLAFHSGVPERITSQPTATGTPWAQPPGPWTSASGASAAPRVPRGGLCGCMPSTMRCPSDAALRDISQHGRFAMVDGDDEVDGEVEEGEGFPSKITLYPDTDNEGEPQVKFVWEIWPAPLPKRHYARTSTALLGQASALPGPAACARAISMTRPCEARQQVVGQAVAAPATATRTPPPRIHNAPVSRKAVAGAATATSVAVFKTPVTVPTAQETHAQAAHECKASHTRRRAYQPDITTLVVRNLHTFTSQQEFLDEVNRSGFAEKYDFAWLPRNFNDGSGKGLAFINFRTASAARAFAGAWHRSRRLGNQDETGKVLPLNVSSASLQGFEANLRKWSSARITRVRNQDFLPFVRMGAEPEPQAPQPEVPELADIGETKPR